MPLNTVMRRAIGKKQGAILTVQLTEDKSAVSYTHLRAHETVLDLVCRLLLEKKKTKENILHDKHLKEIKAHELSKTTLIERSK